MLTSKKYGRKKFFFVLYLRLTKFKEKSSNFKSLSLMTSFIWGGEGGGDDSPPSLPGPDRVKIEFA